MNIHQLSVLFDERQDRLLMRVNTREAQEIRLWLTRRIALKLLAPLELAIAKMESRNASVSLADAQAQSLLVELRQDEFLQKADLKTPYSSQGKSLPLGAEPLVVTEITLNIQPGAGVQMVFLDAGDSTTAERACTLQMQAQLVHGLLHLLQKAMKNAHWRDTGPGSTVRQLDGPVADDDAPELLKPRRTYTH
jgi:hypothetical protein